MKAIFKLKNVYRKQEFYIFITILIICLAIQIQSGQFFTPNNIIDILRALNIPAIFSLGMLIVIISGGIDLSFPALAALCYTTTTQIFMNMNYQGTIILPLIVSALFGLILGSINGVFISYYRIPAMIVTLGTSAIFKGIMLGILKNKDLTVVPKPFSDFGFSSLFVGVNADRGIQSNMPTTFIFLIVFIVIIYFILRRTILGRAIYAIGGNESAAVRAGFNVKRVKMFVYCFQGFLAGLTGLIRVCMQQQSRLMTLFGSEMFTIASVVLGGASIAGGTGTVTGTLLGITLMVIIQNSMLLLGIPSYWQDFFVGIVILVGVSISAIQIKRLKNI